MMVPRFFGALSVASRPLARIFPWLFRSREYGNFTYDTSEISRIGLCGMVAAISGRELATVTSYVNELIDNRMFAEHVKHEHELSERRWSSDSHFHPGRRLFYYLLVRALRPGFVVEAGVDKGLGGAIISEAIRRNGMGDYLGIESNPLQDCSIYETFPEKVGSVVRGDSVAVLASMTRPIDLFIHDTTSESEHVRRQLSSLTMAANGVIASGWPLREFVEYAISHGMRLLTHQEEPVGHWYSGSRLIAIY